MQVEKVAYYNMFIKVLLRDKSPTKAILNLSEKFIFKLKV